MVPTKQSVVSPEALLPHPDVLPVLRQHPPGWIGTIISEGRPPIAVCLADVWCRHNHAPATQLPMLDLDSQRYLSKLYFFIDESRGDWPQVTV